MGCANACKLYSDKPAKTSGAYAALPMQCKGRFSAPLRAPVRLSRPRPAHARCELSNKAPIYHAARSAGDLVVKLVKERVRKLGHVAVGGALAAALLLGCPADAETLMLPVSERPELFAVQKTMVEAWSILSQAYVDPTFNNTDWMHALEEGLDTVAHAPTARDATTGVSQMVAKLGDPFTRWVPPEEYQEFRVSSDGELKGGVGLLIASDPSSGRLVVLAPIKGSPADRAGIRPGDEVLSVDGTSTRGWDGEAAARYLRGQQGSSVMVEVARRPLADEVPGVAAGLRPLPPTAALPVEYKQFRLRRERVELSPVFATAMHYDDHTFGYVRLVNFSQHAAHDMQAAIAQLQRDGAEAFILDLRNNPGGLVRSSLEIASLWMDGDARPTVFSIQDRDDAELANAVANAGAPPSLMAGAASQRVVLNAGHAAASQPLVVLVNRHSASASEILAGALRDNHRAEVIGENTFGKGKIQSVFELKDGSAVFVTVAKYRTPSGAEIDKIGVIPDRACTTAPGGPNVPASVPGIPVGPGADEQVIDELATDSCVLTAEALLGKRADSSGGAVMHVARGPSA